MKIYSVDSTEPGEKQKTSSRKTLLERGFDLRTSDFPVLHSTPELTHHVLSATGIQILIAMLY